MKKTSRASRAWRFVFVLHLYAMTGVLATAALAWIAWKVPRARRWIHSEAARIYLSKVAPRLPFEIRDVDVEAKWPDFVHFALHGGKLASIRLDLAWNGWSIDLTGPIDVFYDHKEPETHVNVVYEAAVQATPPAGRGEKAAPFPVLPLRIAFRAGESLSHLDALSIGTEIADLELPRFGIRSSGLSLAAQWAGNQASVKLTAKELDSSESPGHAFSVSDLALAAGGPLKLKPFAPGPDLTLDLSVSRARAELDGKPLILPLSKFPMHAQVSLGDRKTGFALDTAALSVTGELDGEPAAPTELGVNWKSARIPIVALIAAVRSVRSDLPLLRSLRWVKKISGSVSSSGSARLALPPAPASLSKARIEADLSVRNLGFEWPGHYFALSGANLELPVSSSRGVRGKLSIQRLLFRRLKASLASTRIELVPLDPLRTKLRLHIGTGSAGDASKSRIPLAVDGMPVALGGVDGTISLGTGALSSTDSDYDLDTSFELSPTDASALLGALCISTEHVPPARVSVDLPRIELQPGSVELDADPDAKVEAQLFDGKADVTNIDFYNLDTAVPETDFDLDMDGVRLSEVGAWSGFGEMDGILRAHAHDVVMQAWLPTQYDFSFQAIPYSREKVVFSPEAMRNVARLVASDSIDHLPGVVQWLAFGWPHRMFGGYDVYFFGVSLLSKNGEIRFSALDPPDLPPGLTGEEKQKLLWAQERMHYILYGQWFRIPLNASHYPVRVSATQVSDYVHGMVEKFLKLSQAAEAAKESKALARLVKAAGNAPGSLKKAKEILWHEEHDMDCAPPAL